MSQSHFEIECQEVVGRLKSALIELFDAANADHKKPQDVARQLGVNKTLTWNIARFLDAPVALEALSFAPGAASITKVADAFPGGKRLAEMKQRVRDAASAIDEMVERHAGDRSTLELILDNVLPAEDQRLEVSRRYTFRGQSGIFGVQARTRLSTWFVAPNTEDPTRLDLATLRGYARVRRLRPNVEWPIFKTRVWRTEGQTSEERPFTPLDPRASVENPLLLDFCQGDVPKVELTATPEGTNYMLRSGLVGNAGAFDVFAGELLRSGEDRFAAPGDDIGEVGTSITTPSEHLVFDLLYHRSLTNLDHVESLVFGQIYPQGERTPASDDPRVLPLKPRVVRIAGSPPAVATTRVPRYAEMVQMVFDRAGWSPNDFVGMRVEIDYPPLHSQVMLRFPLERRAP
ncbi:MAG: hypothetical protein IPK69_07965 [Phycisphaerales bacterium]|nr:MAG: hypothetical protein IPK69_07965 [Phycisphaerales bacterium]